MNLIFFFSTLGESNPKFGNLINVCFHFVFCSAEANSLKIIPPVPPPPKEYSIPVQIEKSPVTKNVKINPSPKYYDAKRSNNNGQTTTTDESSSFDEKIYKDERIVIIQKRPSSSSNSTGNKNNNNSNKSKLAEVILDEVNQHQKKNSSNCIKTNANGRASGAATFSSDMDSLSSIETKVHQFDELVEKENDNNNSGEFAANNKYSNDFSDLNAHFNGNNNFGSRNSSRPTSRMSSNYQSYQFSGKTHTIYF